MNLSFDQPEFFLLLIPVAVIMAWAGARLRLMDTTRRVSILALRGALMLALASALALPVMRHLRTEQTLIGIYDVSQSVRDLVAPFQSVPVDPPGNPGDEPPLPTGPLESMRSWMNAASSGRQPGDRIGLIVADGTSLAMRAPEDSDLTDDVPVEPGEPGTDLGAALELAAAMVPGDGGSRIVLISDGSQTSGNARQRAQELLAPRGIPVDVLPLVPARRADIRVVQVDVPPAASAGQTITARIVIESTAPARAQLFLRREGERLDLDPDAEGTGRWLDLGGAEGESRTTVLVEVPVLDRPVNRLVAAIEPENPQDNAVSTNDSAESFTVTTSTGRVLYVSRDSASQRMIPSWLESGGVECVSGGLDALPEDLIALQNYELIILSGLSAWDLSEAQHRALFGHVHDFGAGLIVSGGPAGLGAGGWNGTELEALLPLELDPRRELRVIPAALVIVMDASGSMRFPVAGARASQMTIAAEAAARAVESLQRESSIGIIAFNERATIVHPLSPNDDPDLVRKRLEAIAPDGGTDMGDGLEAAEEMLRGVKADRKWVICLSDGQSRPADFERIVERLRAGGTRLTTIAIGNEADHELLERLADRGEGSFIPVFNAQALPRVLVDSVRVLNQSLLKERPFVPVRRAGAALAGLPTDFPPLSGIVRTAGRTDVPIDLEIVDDEGDPVLALGTAGLGRVAVFTSEDEGSWSSQWQSWEGAGPFWLTLARATRRSSAPSGAVLEAAVERGELRVTLLVDDDSAPITGASARVHTPRGTSISAELRPAGPGVYELTTPVSESGAYIVAATPRTTSGVMAPLIGGVMQRGPDELVVRRDAHDLLRDVARLTGGRVLDPGDAPGAALLDQQQRIPRERTQTPWRLLLVPALILLLLDIAARRISWNRQSAGLLLRRTGERRIDPSLRAAATLSALRTSAAPRAELLAVKDDSVRPSGIAPEIGRSVDEPKETPAIEAPAAAPADRQAQIRRALDAVLGRSARAEISDAPDARKEAPHDVAPPPAEDAMSALRAAKARAKGRRGSGRE